jgi:Ran GTPase-activating protein (RanGAP) involved in mRNA processing and transport
LFNAIQQFFKNTALEILDISWNGLETGGAHGIAHGLESNSTLKELNISSNRINQTGLAKLLQGLMRNSSLYI